MLNETFSVIFKHCAKVEPKNFCMSSLHTWIIYYNRSRKIVARPLFWVKSRKSQCLKIMLKSLIFTTLRLDVCNWNNNSYRKKYFSSLRHFLIIFQHCEICWTFCRTQVFQLGWLSTQSFWWNIWEENNFFFSILQWEK